MPPFFALYGFHFSPEAWRKSSELAALTSYVERALQTERERPRGCRTCSPGYENLRTCLPEAS